MNHFSRTYGTVEHHTLIIDEAIDPTGVRFYPPVKLRVGSIGQGWLGLG